MYLILNKKHNKLGLVMSKYFLNKVLFTLFVVLHFCFAANITYINAQAWTKLEAGLKYMELQNPDNSKELIYILSFDPKYFNFNLFNVSENKHSALTLKQWAKQENLVAAINASMYLPDKTTSTGYMRNNGHINNKHIAKNFGAFFVAKPYLKDNLKLPSADILDKNTDNWQDILSKYEVVVQNFRLTNAKKEILWKNTNSPYSISAIGKDGSGNILLMHISYAIKPYKFAQLLLQSPLDIGIVMYTEGGYQAGLLVAVPKLTKLWHGNTFVDFLIPNKIDVLLPNIIGVTRKQVLPAK